MRIVSPNPDRPPTRGGKSIRCRLMAKPTLLLESTTLASIVDSLRSDAAPDARCLDALRRLNVSMQSHVPHVRMIEALSSHNLHWSEIGAQQPDWQLSQNQNATANWIARSSDQTLTLTGDLSERIDTLIAHIAADTLRRGGLIAMPTETVYGLGADARQSKAIARVFAVKGRPAGHPLIVHLADAKAMNDWAIDIPDLAWQLAAQCWPGPLTLILKRAAHVSDALTGGQPTIGLRVPDHTLTLQMLRAFGGGVAAPSANRFGRVSPTTAQHVIDDLQEDVDFVLDGGPCDVGIESTIVDLSGNAPVLLRPGGWPVEMLEAIAGRPIPATPSSVRAPGSHASHYAPRAQVRITTREQWHAEAAALEDQGLRVHRVAPDARTLYAEFREADRLNADIILIPQPEPAGLGRAIADRMQRAAARPTE